MRFGKRQEESRFDTGKVDLVAESADGIIELVVVADRPWTGSDLQVSSLQGKVQTYVSFALDGGLAQQFPEAAGRPWRIVLHCLTGAPDARTQSVLDVLATRLPEYGGLCSSVLSEGPLTGTSVARFAADQNGLRAAGYTRQISALSRQPRLVIPRPRRMSDMAILSVLLCALSALVTGCSGGADSNSLRPSESVGSPSADVATTAVVRTAVLLATPATLTGVPGMPTTACASFIIVI